MKKYTEPLINVAIIVIVGAILVGAFAYYKVPDLWAGLMTGFLLHDLNIEFKSEEKE